MKDTETHKMKMAELQMEHHAMEDEERKKGKLWAEIPSFGQWLVQRIVKAEAGLERVLTVLHGARHGDVFSADDLTVANCPQCEELRG